MLVKETLCHKVEMSAYYIFLNEGIQLKIHLMHNRDYYQAITCNCHNSTALFYSVMDAVHDFSYKPHPHYN